MNNVKNNLQKAIDSVKNSIAVLNNEKSKGKTEIKTLIRSVNIDLAIEEYKDELERLETLLKSEK